MALPITFGPPSSTETFRDLEGKAIAVPEVTVRRNTETATSTRGTGRRITNHRYSAKRTRVQEDPSLATSTRLERESAGIVASRRRMEHEEKDSIQLIRHCDRIINRDRVTPLIRGEQELQRTAQLIAEEALGISSSSSRSNEVPSHSARTQTTITLRDGSLTLTQVPVESISSTIHWMRNEGARARGYTGGGSGAHRVPFVMPSAPVEMGHKGTPYPYKPNEAHTNCLICLLDFEIGEMVVSVDCCWTPSHVQCITGWEKSKRYGVTCVGCNKRYKV
jgi:hypothetical protein